MENKLFNKARELANKYNLLEDTEKSQWLTYRLYVMKFTNSEKEVYIYTSLSIFT